MEGGRDIVSVFGPGRGHFFVDGDTSSFVNSEFRTLYEVGEIGLEEWFPFPARFIAQQRNWTRGVVVQDVNESFHQIETMLIEGLARDSSGQSR